MATPIYTPLVADGANGLMFSSAKSGNYGRYSQFPGQLVNVPTQVVITLGTTNHASPFIVPGGGGNFSNTVAGDYELTFQGTIGYTDNTTQFDVSFFVNGAPVVTTRQGAGFLVGSYGFTLSMPGVPIAAGSNIQLVVQRVAGAGIGNVSGNLFITLK